jgi:hypothetical protein
VRDFKKGVFGLGIGVQQRESLSDGLLGSQLELRVLTEVRVALCLEEVTGEFVVLRLKRLEDVPRGLNVEGSFVSKPSQSAGNRRDSLLTLLNVNVALLAYVHHPALDACGLQKRFNFLDQRSRVILCPAFFIPALAVIAEMV